MFGRFNVSLAIYFFDIFTPQRRACPTEGIDKTFQIS